MNIQELIDKLEEMKKQHGNNLVVWTDFEDSLFIIDELKFVENKYPDEVQCDGYVVINSCY